MFELGLIVAFAVGFLLCWRPSRLVIGFLLAWAIVKSDPLSPLALCLIAGFSLGIAWWWLRADDAGLAEDPATEQ